MSLRKKQQEATRRAILDALGAQIAESGTMGFSVKDVAKRAGVTHRTVYNHFPTREALNEAFAVHVEEEMVALGIRPPEVGMGITDLPAVMAELYPLLQSAEASCRAYVMLMIASRAPAGVMRERSRAFEALLQDEWGPLPPEQARAITAALRMFASSAGWHLLTEHHGLSGSDAGATAQWATRVLLDAISRGDRPTLESRDEPAHDS